MLTVETIGRIRREHFLKGKTIKEIARDLRVSRNTVRQVLRSSETSFEYEREVQPRPKLGTFAPGDTYQFDRSHEVVLLNGTTVIVKVAHVRLCHSRMLFVRAHPRETQEMVFDAHDRAFVLFKGACVRGIYDNMKTAVDTIFAGKDRHYNRRFLQMCSHYLVDPVACPPAVDLALQVDMPA
jgi:predicted transcriptional regulator